MTITLIKPADGEVSWTADVNSNWLMIENAINGAGGAPGQFGDASNGSLTLVANTTLTQDVFYENLTTGTFTLSTGGYRIYVRTKLTVTAGGSITSPGGNASGATGGLGAPEGSVENGADGVDGTTGVGAAGNDNIDS